MMTNGSDSRDDSCPEPLRGIANEKPAAGIGVRHWHEDGDAHLDVRGLVPPQPLVAIMRLLASADAGTSVVVHLDRDPVMLYPELERTGWQADHLLGNEGEVRLRLRRTV